MFEDFYLNVELVKDDVKIPRQSNKYDAGFDVFAPYWFTIDAGGDALIPLQWRCSFPKNYCLKFANKSGRSTKDKLIVGANIVDHGYTGIVHTHLFNLGEKKIYIDKDEKISQFLVIPVWHGKANIVDKIGMNTERGSGGFGSTGLK